jgi:hypothetical protein
MFLSRKMEDLSFARGVSQKETRERELSEWNYVDIQRKEIPLHQKIVEALQMRMGLSRQRNSKGHWFYLGLLFW